MSAPGLFGFEIICPEVRDFCEQGLEPVQPRQTFIITGAPRSGTSLTAGLLHRAGVHLGSDLIGPVPFNECGLYEDAKFVLLNDLILATAGGSWLTPPVGGIAQDHQFRGPMTILARYEQRELWGLKDGRFCLLFSEWQPIFQDLNPHVIVMTRNLSSVARSMHNWWRVGVDHGIFVAALYYLRLGEFLAQQRDWPVLYLAYEDMIYDTEAQITRLRRFTDLDISDEIVAQFLDPKLKHF